MTPAEPVIAVSGLCKAFSGKVALDEVSMELRAGEVHCLAGENGAGKSTVIRILTGAIRRDSGEYVVDGRPLPVSLTPAATRAAGIGAVYQELSLLPHLSAAENLLMGRLPSRGGVLDRGRLREQARARLDRVGLGGLDPSTVVSELPAATRQLVEVAKVLGDEPRVIIFDEPTTALSGSEAESLLRRISALRDAGVAVLYVSHRLEEMFEIGDRVTVLRDGAVTRSAEMVEFTEDTLIAAMVGRDVEELYPRGTSAGNEGAALLRVRGLRPRGGGHAVDLDVRAGEVLGVAGLLGAGRSELLRGIFGADPPESGTVEVDGKRVPPGRPADSVRAGIGLLSEDRKELGLLPELSIRENVSVASLRGIGRRGLLSARRESGAVDEVLDGMRLRAGSYDAPVSTLSGGNQQKVLIARWLVSDVRVLLFDEPTKGVDVGAKAELYTLIGDLAARGFAIVVVSSYLPELLGLADRILVLRAGAAVGEVPAAEATEEGLLRLASTGVPEGENGAA
ncbi:D-ribose transporter ATP-binding protein [Amycolatopsis antarctica]|uniref:D-ribose transporter ATP-binding protein n=1 Tax=Amycolatopsis antarctica TaxID=1854586 RepID=A0A263D246_9PSEU|nr:sugar ABC transporter ATP-binding protein [Amycolatopsis antarctica]OZM72421.1 D-ribose transporter ATP-binding protein [Amycolatopsis antarctica]